MSRCNTKTLYDTEFEATVRAAKRTADWGEEMEPYPCGKHWHIAHVDKSLRNHHTRPPQKDWCEACGQHMKPGRWAKHRTFYGHIQKVRQLREKRLKEALEKKEPQ